MRASIFLISTVMVVCLWPGIACAQETVRKPARTPIYTKEGTASCLRCHSGVKMRAMSASPHFDTRIKGAPATAQGCESCHGRGSIHISRAHGGKGFPPLTRFGRGDARSPREEQLQACLSCHADKSKEEKRIIFLGSAHDRSNINCSTCHTMHAESDQVSDKESQAKTCGRCHRGDIRDHPRFEEKSIDFEALSCATCHDVHAPAQPQE